MINGRQRLSWKDIGSKYRAGVVEAHMICYTMRGRVRVSKGVAYQNKDIEFKVLSESFKEKSFAAYGLNLPRIKDVLPTNLPAVSANELRMDNLFLLEDHTYALVDYESENTVEDRIKYVDYIARIVKRFYKENTVIPGIRMVVIYTGDVEQAEDTFHMGCMVRTRKS